MIKIEIQSFEMEKINLSKRFFCPRLSYLFHERSQRRKREAATVTAALEAAAPVALFDVPKTPREIMMGIERE